MASIPHGLHQLVNIYRFNVGTIKEDCGNAIYAVEDTVGNVEKIVRDDIISDQDDADNIINVSCPFFSVTSFLSLFALEDPSVRAHAVEYPFPSTQ